MQIDIAGIKENLEHRKLQLHNDFKGIQLSSSDKSIANAARRVISDYKAIEKMEQLLDSYTTDK